LAGVILLALVVVLDSGQEAQMIESEKQLLHEVAVEEIKKNWPFGLMWLAVVLIASSLIVYGGWRAIFG
jgi:hypothetical protein